MSSSFSLFRKLCRKEKEKFGEIEELEFSLLYVLGIIAIIIEYAITQNREVSITLIAIFVAWWLYTMFVKTEFK